MKVRGVISVIVLTVASFSFSVSRAEIQSNQARILHIQGIVQVKAPGEDIWKVPRKGVWVKKGSQVKTGADSSCSIGLGASRHSIVHLKSNSQTFLHTLEAEKTRVHLEAGSTLIRVRDLKPGTEFEVASPTAVATARGTGWEQTMDAVQVFEHAVQVESSNGESMLVEEGKGIDFEENGLGEVFEVPVDAKSEWENFDVEADRQVAEEANLPVDPGYETASEPAVSPESMAQRDSASGTEEPPAPTESDEKSGVEPPNDPNTPDDSAELRSTDTPADMSDDTTGMGDERNSDSMEHPDLPDSTRMDSDMPEPDAGSMMESPENLSDGFNDSLGSTDAFEPPGSDMQDTLSDIREEIQNSLPPPDFDPDDNNPDCYEGSQSIPC